MQQCLLDFKKYHSAFIIALLGLPSVGGSETSFLFTITPNIKEASKQGDLEKKVMNLGFE